MSLAVLGPMLGTAAIVASRGALAAAGRGLSFAGELLREAGGTGDARPPDKAASLEQQTADLLRRIDEMAIRIRRQLAAAGIELMQPVELVSDGLGGVAVGGPHPQQALIEEALARDVLLERDFHRLSEEYQALAAQHGTDGWPIVMTVRVPAEPLHAALRRIEPES